MSDKSYPDYEPAWVEDPASPGAWSLYWLDADGQPIEPIGVDREIDVPGIHTPAAKAAIAAMSADRQAARVWPSQIPADPAPEAPSSAPEEPVSVPEAP